MISIIPAIDIIEGKCVRLSRGDYNRKKIYNEDPLEVAKQFEEHGLKRLHLVDLDGAKEKHIVNRKVLEKIAGKTNLEIDFGGGIKSDEDIRVVFASGADMATVGSIAVKEKELFLKWLKTYGPDRIILGADVNDKKIAITGWLEDTDINLFDFIHDYRKEGIVKILCTDISKDGMLEGTSMELYKEIKSRFADISLIASGGISGMDEVKELNITGISGVIIGKAIYENRIRLSDLERFILENK